MAFSGQEKGDDTEARPYGVLCYDDDPQGSNVWLRERDTYGLGVRLVCFSALNVRVPTSPNASTKLLTITCIHHPVEHRAGVVLRFDAATVSGREPTDRGQLGRSTPSHPTTAFVLSDPVPPRLYTNDIAIFAIANDYNAAFLADAPWANEVSSHDNGVRVDVLTLPLPAATTDPINNKGSGNFAGHAQNWAAGVFVLAGPTPTPTPAPTEGAP